MPDVIDDCATGLLFNPQPADLKEKIDMLFARNDSVELRKKLGTAAREKFLREYTADRAYELLSAIYNHAIARRAAT